MKTKNLAIISMALAVVAIVGSSIYLSQSPEQASQEAGSTTTTKQIAGTKTASSNIVSVQANFVLSDK